VIKTYLVAISFIYMPIAQADEQYPVSDHAVGHSYACKDDGYCQDLEMEFTSMPGCVAGMMPFMAEWIGNHEGFHLKTGTYECHPKAQVRV
jgi:hypothetical protein